MCFPSRGGRLISLALAVEAVPARALVDVTVGVIALTFLDHCDLLAAFLALGAPTAAFAFMMAAEAGVAGHVKQIFSLLLVLFEGSRVLGEVSFEAALGRASWRLLDQLAPSGVEGRSDRDAHRFHWRLGRRYFFGRAL